MRRLLLVGCLAFSAAAHALDGADVEQLVAHLESAAARRDADALARYLSDRLSVVTEVRLASGKRERVVQTKAQYLESLRQTWRHLSRYHYAREATRIAFPAPGRAVVTATVRETMSVFGHAAQNTASETLVIELVSGKPMITALASSAAL